MPPIQRPTPITSHPVYIREYRIPTPTIEKFYLLVQRSLRFRIPGAIIYGRSRFGKSRAIEFLEALFAQKDRTLPLIKLDCQRKKAPSELGFFSNLLFAASHAAVSGGTTTALRLRLNNRLREIAERVHSNRIVLFADDAQRLTEIEYAWLQEVYDAMRRHRTRSGWTYTRFFLPKAYDAGLRLAVEGAPLWDAFVEAHRQARLPGDVEIPMEYFSRTVEYVLTEHVSKDSEQFKLNGDIWKEAVQYSGFAQALELISPAFAEP